MDLGEGMYKIDEIGPIDRTERKLGLIALDMHMDEEEEDKDNIDGKNKRGRLNRRNIR